MTEGKSQGAPEWDGEADTLTPEQEIRREFEVSVNAPPKGWRAMAFTLCDTVEALREQLREAEDGETRAHEMTVLVEGELDTAQAEIRRLTSALRDAKPVLLRVIELPPYHGMSLADAAALRALAEMGE